MRDQHLKELIEAKKNELLFIRIGLLFAKLLAAKVLSGLTRIPEQSSCVFPDTEYSP